MEQLTIDSILYDVLKNEAREDVETTRPNMANAMQQRGALRLLWLRRPRGKKTYIAYDFGVHPYKKQYRILG